MPDGATYVSPRPAITLKGQPNSDMARSLLDITVRAPEMGMASAELRLVNWGDQASGSTNFLFNQVALGDKIEIAFGLSQQKSVFKGEITGIEERYGDGVPQIVLLAEDALHRLARHRANPNVQGFVKGAYAAAIGTILGACILLGRIAIGDWLTLLIGVTSLAVLFRWKLNNPLLIAARRCEHSGSRNTNRSRHTLVSSTMRGTARSTWFITVATA